MLRFCTGLGLMLASTLACNGIQTTRGGGGASDSSPSGGSYSGGGDGGGAGGDGFETVAVCKYECETDADCTVDGIDYGHRCTNRLCVQSCIDDTDCMPTASLWKTPCSSDSDCNGGHCMDGGTDRGFCAIAPSASAPCSLFGQVEVAGRTVSEDYEVVCGADNLHCGPSGRCHDCAADCRMTGCSAGFVCNYAGHCSCTSDEVCMAQGLGDACSPLGACFFLCESPSDCPPNSEFDGLKAKCWAAQ